MMGNKKLIKALEFENYIDNTWFDCETNYDKTLINNLLKRCDIWWDREDIMDYGNLRLSSIIDEYGLDKVIKLFNTYIPSNKDNVFGDCSEVTCNNFECKYHKEKVERNSKYLGCYSSYASCWEDMIICVQIAIAIGGASAKKELISNWGVNEELIDIINDNEKGWYEEELYSKSLSSICEASKKFKKEVYGDENMFMEKFINLNHDGEISVYWVEDMMYINDEDENQAIVVTDLFSAYRFSNLIYSSSFDYTVNDDELKEFHEKLLEFHKKRGEQSYGFINVWEYLDSISEDFEKLSGIKINTIENKRNIVSLMCNIDGMRFGSMPYIKKLLVSSITNSEKQEIKPFLKFFEDYNCDLSDFAKKLHDFNNDVEFEIDGDIVINDVEFNVDKIIITNNMAKLYKNDIEVSRILKKNINSVGFTNNMELVKMLLKSNK